MGGASGSGKAAPTMAACLALAALSLVGSLCCFAPPVSYPARSQAPGLQSEAHAIRVLRMAKAERGLCGRRLVVDSTGWECGFRTSKGTGLKVVRYKDIQGVHVSYGRVPTPFPKVVYTLYSRRGSGCSHRPGGYCFYPFVKADRESAADIAAALKYMVDRAHGRAGEAAPSSIQGPAEGGVRPGCSTDMDCKGERICVDGRCASPSGATGRCRTDMDCPGKRLCERARCVPSHGAAPSAAVPAAEAPRELVVPRDGRVALAGTWIRRDGARGEYLRIQTRGPEIIVMYFIGSPADGAPPPAMRVHAVRWDGAVLNFSHRSPDGSTFHHRLRALSRITLEHLQTIGDGARVRMIWYRQTP